jgi:hypothetical protein
MWGHPHPRGGASGFLRAGTCFLYEKLFCTKHGETFLKSFALLRHLAVITKKLNSVAVVRK